MKKILFVAGSGGHAAQLALLLQQIGDKYHSELLLERSDRLGFERFSKKYRIYTACALRGKYESVIKTFFRILWNSFQSLIILVKSNPDLIITTGPGLGIPVCLCGKIAGKKVVVIESWSRIESRSYTSRVLYAFSDLFFVQWPEMLKHYPKAKYAGRLA